MVGGTGPHEGNVHLNGMPVCEWGWDLKDAWVACIQSGFFGVREVTRSSKFGQVSTLAIRSWMECTGEELLLTDCER